MNQINLDKIIVPTSSGTLEDSGFPTLSFPDIDFSGVAKKLNEEIVKATELLDNGKKLFDDNKFAEAAECFSQATEIVVQQNGYQSPETGEFAYHYGLTLMHLARETQAQGNMFGEAMTEALEKEAMARGLGGELEPESDESMDGSGSGSESGEEGSEELSGDADFDGDEEGSSEEGEHDPKAETEENEEGSEDEDEDNLAWKWLEIARIALTGQAVLKYQQLLHDVYMALGNMAIDAENWADAPQDFQKAIEVLEEAKVPARELAAAYFTVGVHLSSIPLSSNTLQESDIHHFATAIQILTRAKDTDPSADATEIADTIQEIKERHEEIKQIWAEVKADPNFNNNGEQAPKAEAAQINPFTKKEFDPTTAERPVNNLGVVRGKKKTPANQTPANETQTKPKKRAPKGTESNKKRKAEGDIKEDTKKRKL